MASEDDIKEVIEYLRAARVHKCPHPDDRGVQMAYADCLRAMRSDVVLQAARAWIADPESGRFFPTAADLLSLCMTIEADERHTVRHITRGCAGCGELLAADGSVSEHGTGFRHFVQHCHPMGDDGRVDWHAVPYRIGHRLVICDCEKGRQIAAQQQIELQREIPKGQVPSRPANWRPTLTLSEAWKAFNRHDARNYVSGSSARLVSEDSRPGSPWYTRPSPEEEHGPTPEQTRIRRAVYQAMRGNVSDEAAAFLQRAGLAMGGDR
jgi:hypothetical protein